MKKYVLGAILMLPLLSIAQKSNTYVSGAISSYENGSKKPLPGAYVRWIYDKRGVFANDSGHFKLLYNGQTPKIVVSYISFKTDTFEVNSADTFYKFTLRYENELKGAIIRAQRFSYGLSRLDPRTTIILGEREFQKAACCNLSESFENEAAIDANFADAVTGTKQIQMLGLDGFYTLISNEYMPTVRTLNAYYGLSHIPAPWVNSIQITKGAGSVVNGYESIAGQINVEQKKPFGNEVFMLDQFASEGGRFETDLMYKKDISSYLSTALFGRYATRAFAMDRNNDGFLDMPLSTDVAILNRWQWNNKSGLEGIFNFRLHKINQEGGQKEFLENKVGAYGLTIDTRSIDLSAKLGKPIKNKPWASFGSQWAYNKTFQNTNFGSAQIPSFYNAEATQAYINLLYESKIVTTFHKFQTGISLLYDWMQESTKTFGFEREEIVPGAFFEYTYKPTETFSIVGGLRSDYNSIFGFSVTPRFHSKYRFNKEKTAFRLSAGTGRRTANPLSQNQQMFISSRNIQFIESNRYNPYWLNQERAFNTGISLEHNFDILLSIKNTISADFFHTQFMEEVVFDRETPGKVLFYNTQNGTRANSTQVQWDIKPFRLTEFRMAYRIFDVQTYYLDKGYLQKPLMAKHRGFASFTQSTRNAWQMAIISSFVGKQRMPQTGVLAVKESHFSPRFVLLNVQLSKTIKKTFELYAGVENLTNFKQKNAILDAANPFSGDFDAGLVYGPIFGRMAYGGFRWRLSK